MHDADPDVAALLRITLTYAWRHGRLPDLTDPTLFTELVQVRKLRDRDPRMPVMADKVAVKALVADRLGRDWMVPTLWSGERLPPHATWDQPVVVKSRHGCNQTLFLDAQPVDWPAARARTAMWMRKAYGAWLDEWLYGLIPRGLLIEPFIGSGPDLPIDYKFYVFDGRVTHIQVHVDRGRRHRWVIHDRYWRALADDAPAIAQPSALSAMIAAAEEMGRGFDFARVDLYQPGDRPLFGEISFYPGSGLDPFDPPELDAELGRLWLRAGVSRMFDRPSGIATGGEAVV